jgi:hypothetical protein
VKIDTSTRPNFKILNSDFAKDDFSVYYKESILKDIDPSTFEILSSEIIKDKSAVYSVSTNTEIKTNSPKAWIIIIPLDLKVWTESKTVFLKLEDADPKSFFLLEKDDVPTKYGYDGKQLYYGATYLENVERADLKFQKSYFHTILKTEKNLYFEENKIPGIDLLSFSSYDHYAKDKNKCYFIKYSGVSDFPCNVKYFQPLQFPNPLDEKTNMESGYAIDDTFVFFEGKRIVGSNPKSFRLITSEQGCVADGYCGRDDKYFYEMGQVK